MDNIDNELEALRAQLTNGDAQQKKVEEQPKPAEVEKPEAVAAPIIEEKKTDDLILGKFKTNEDLAEAYMQAQKELTKKSQELAEARKAPQPVTETSKPSVELDSLWKALFQDEKVVEPAKVQSTPAIAPETGEIAPENAKLELELKNLKSKFGDIQKAVAAGLLQQQAAQGKIHAADTLKDDPILPWSKEVEKELEEKVFKEFPNLQYQPDGWMKAHKILRGEKADLIAQQKVDAAVKAAIEKENAKRTAVVETPSKTVEAPKTLKVEDLSPEDLRKYLSERIGINQYKEGTGYLGLGSGRTFL